jgi:hypothetical protein
MYSSYIVRRLHFYSYYIDKIWDYTSYDVVNYECSKNWNNLNKYEAYV